MPSKKYKIEKEETKQQFVTRIVENENAPLTANAVVSLIDKRSMKDVKASKIHANLSDAAKHGLIGKTRFQAEGDSRAYVHYHPVDMVVPGEDIPIPAYEKQGGYSKTDSFTKKAIDSFNESVNRKPAAVKVTEKVIADIAGLPADGPTVSDDKPAKREPVVEMVDIGTGWVEMVDGVPKKFTPNALTSIADSFNATPEVTVEMLVRFLKTRPIDWNQDTQRTCFFIKGLLKDGYGLSAHRRK